MQTIYKPRTIAGATRRVRELQSQLESLERHYDRVLTERNLLAKIAANGPAFFNPLEAMAATKLRDEILRDVWRMTPSGNPLPRPTPGA